MIYRHFESFTSIKFEYGKTGRIPIGVFRVSRNRIRRNIAAYAACADPYSSEFGPEYLAFRAVTREINWLVSNKTRTYAWIQLTFQIILLSKKRE